MKAKIFLFMVAVFVPTMLIPQNGNSGSTPVTPVTMSFNAIMNKGKIDITWETAVEYNSDYFTIEKSRDGINFQPVSFVNASGTSNIPVRYTEADFSPLPEISYYRLKETKLSGKVNYSEVVPVNYTFSADGTTLYPNGVATSAIVAPAENEQVLVVLKDLTGAEFYSKVSVLSANDKITAIDPENKLSPGTYLVIASSNNTFYSRDLVIK